MLLLDVYVCVYMCLYVRVCVCVPVNVCICGLSYSCGGQVEFMRVTPFEALKEDGVGVAVSGLAQCCGPEAMQRSKAESDGDRLESRLFSLMFDVKNE